MVWTISLEEFLINGSILQGSKDLRLSNLIVRFRKELNLDQFLLRSSFRSPSFQKTRKEYLFRVGIAAAMFQKEDPVTLRQRTGNDS
ncbi:hypothetical protein TNCV_3280371 [Trichonephila clavipes]|nr:hypothetical protein TNCV_3280371 [Trichonephila clavipes]